MRRIFSLALILLMIIPYASAVPILDASSRFLIESKDYLETTQEISLSLMALISSYSTAENLTKEDIEPFVEELLERQNSDGGWGYYEGSISNVVDTSYAVIALKFALTIYQAGEKEYKETSSALKKGVRFIVDSYSINGWGYVPNTLSEFYPTLMAIWALGENGYSVEDEKIRSAIEYLEGVKKTGLREGEEVALKIIAYTSVGYKVEKQLIERAWELANSEDTTTKEKALLTYAILNYEGMTFETAKLVSNIEKLSKRNGTRFVYWFNEPKPLVEDDAVITSAWATLDIAYAELDLPLVLARFSRDFCSIIKSSQNSEGGWGYLPGQDSNEMVTYYALKNTDLCLLKKEEIDKALNWAKNRLSTNQENVLRERTISKKYVYNLLILARFNMLSEEEKEENIQLIKSLKLKDGLWGNVLGPQPKDTALAIKALLALGVPKDDPDIQKAKQWLLSISHGGWGTYVSSRYGAYMLTPEVETTIEVLEALMPISTRDELKPHVEWLLEQKADGGWPNIKKLYFYGVLIYTGEPRIDLTARAIALLKELGYNYHKDFTGWILDQGAELEDKKNLLEIVLVLHAIHPKPHEIDIRWVNKIFENEGYQVVYTPGKYYTARFVQSALEVHLNSTAPLSEFKTFENSNYVVVGSLNDFNLSRYNPYLSIEVSGNVLVVNGVIYPLQDETTIIAAGKHENGYLLFVLYNKSSKAVRDIFSSGMFKYFRAPAVVVWYEPSNFPWSMPKLRGDFVR